MPKIVIEAQTADGTRGEPMLAERVIPAELQNEHYLAQLVERIGWALLDAEECEAGAEHPAADPARRPRRAVPTAAGHSLRQSDGGRRRSVPTAQYLRVPK